MEKQFKELFRGDKFRLTKTGAICVRMPEYDTPKHGTYAYLQNGKIHRITESDLNSLVFVVQNTK